MVGALDLRPIFTALRLSDPAKQAQLRALCLVSLAEDVMSEVDLSEVQTPSGASVYEDLRDIRDALEGVLDYALMDLVTKANDPKNASKPYVVAGEVANG